MKRTFESLPISKSKTMLKLKDWSPVFNISLDLTVIKFDTFHKRNIFHFTDLENNGIDVDRLPAMWLNEDKEIEICHSTSEDRYFCKNYQVDLNKKYHIDIHQIDETLKIYIFDDPHFKMIANVTNTYSNLLKNVVVFTSNPWDLPFSSEYGMVSNFIISSEFTIQSKHFHPYNLD